MKLRCKINKFLKDTTFNIYFSFQVFNSPIDILSLKLQWTNKTIKSVILSVLHVIKKILWNSTCADISCSEDRPHLCSFFMCNLTSLRTIAIAESYIHIVVQHKSCPKIFYSRFLSWCLVSLQLFRKIFLKYFFE